MSYLSSIEANQESIVTTMASVASQATATDIESHLEMVQELSEREETLIPKLTKLYRQERARMACVVDVTGIVSFGHFSIGTEKFYLLIAMSSHSQKVEYSDLAIFCADTKGKLGLALQKKGVSDKSMSEWIHKKFWGWKWPEIVTTWA